MIRPDIDNYDIPERYECLTRTGGMDGYITDGLCVWDVPEEKEVSKELDKYYRDLCKMNGCREMLYNGGYIRQNQ